MNELLQNSFGREINTKRSKTQPDKAFIFVISFKD